MPNIRKNFICELGVLAVLSRDSGQHPRKFYLRKFPAIRYVLSCMCLQIEYDLANSSEDDLQLLALDRIEQSAVPLAMEMFPPVSKEPFIVTANDQVCLCCIHTYCTSTDWGSNVRCVCVVYTHTVLAGLG